ncbi:hypothetical protein HDV05_000034 [Chytridiales sp. JEL 0842]|nr:hypothetical protein HDV05_000034 [Chytridiales sp. JEL 0842]
MGDTVLLKASGCCPRKNVPLSTLCRSMTLLGPKKKRKDQELVAISSVLAMARTHKSCGFVNFDRLEDAILAKRSMNGKEILGTVLKIGYAKVPGVTSPTSSVFQTRPLLNSRLPNSVTVDNTLSEGPLNGSPKQGSERRLNAFEIASLLSIDISTIMPTHVREYATFLPPLPEPSTTRTLDQPRLRELRKKLDGHISAMDFDLCFAEIIEETVDLCTDYIGNVLIQRLIEKSNDIQKLQIITRIAPHIASIGIHKNGTWVVQKMIDYARTPEQMDAIVEALRPFTPQLLLDQFGNYVIQCCLKFDCQRNQFVFDAMQQQALEIGLGRFGARAIRTCLESQQCSIEQQAQVAVAILEHALEFILNPNVNQRIEPDAKLIIIDGLLNKSGIVLKELLLDHIQGVPVLQKLLSSNGLTMEERILISDRLRLVVAEVAEILPNHGAYKRLFDELSLIPQKGTFVGPKSYGTITTSFYPTPTGSPRLPESNEYYKDYQRPGQASTSNNRDGFITPLQRYNHALQSIHY